MAKVVVLPVRIPAELYELLRARTVSHPTPGERQSMSAWVVAAIGERIAREENKP